MSKIYCLTKLGRRVYRNGSLSEEEMRVVGHLRENKSASDDQLEVVGGSRWLLGGLERRGMIKELTT